MCHLLLFFQSVPCVQQCSSSPSTTLHFLRRMQTQPLLRNDLPPMEAQVARGIIADAPHVLDVVQLGAHMGASGDLMSPQWRPLLPVKAPRRGARRLGMTRQHDIAVLAIGN